MDPGPFTSPAYSAWFSKTSIQWRWNNGIYGSLVPNENKRNKVTSVENKEDPANATQLNHKNQTPNVEKLNRKTCNKEKNVKRLIGIRMSIGDLL